jgi:poly(A) polymerase
MIGDATARYREDPVRIIRAVRFSAKLNALGFKMDPKTSGPLIKSQALLADVPQSRLFDEMLKLLQTGHALASIAQLKALGMQTGIYPLLDVVVERADQPFVNAALKDTDRRVGEGKPVAPSFLLACVLWADVRDGWAQRVNERQHSHPALQDAIEDVFNARIGDVSGRGKLAGDMREIWLLQPRFEKRVGSTPFGMVEQPRFRAAFDFMRLRADVGEIEEVLADWWQEFSLADDNLRQDMIDEVRAEQQARPKGPRVQRAPAPLRDKPAPAPGPGAVGAPAQTQAHGDDGGAAPRKRRRRRKPGGAAGGDGDASVGGSFEG